MTIRAARSLLSIGALAAGAVVCGSCNQARPMLPAYAEALISVDTDLAVPGSISRLRVDVFDEKGTWRDSHDIARPDPHDWPASFSVYSDDDTRDRVVMLRLRAYPDGYTRDYHGDHADHDVDLPSPVVPIAPHTTDEMCSTAPDLRAHSTVTLRRAHVGFTAPLVGGACLADPATLDPSGTVAAYVDLAEPAEWSFRVLSSTHQRSQRLQLRTSCADPASAIACSSGTEVRALVGPGRVWLLIAGVDPLDAPTDLVVGASRAIDPPPRPIDDPSPPSPIVLHWEPDDPRPVPATEPMPSVTVDRLVRLRLRPGVRGSATIILRGECAGAPVHLAIDGYAPNVQRARTCIDADRRDEALVDEPLDPSFVRALSSFQGYFGSSSGCIPAKDGVACIQGGPFIFGNTEGAAPGDAFTLAPRIARVSTFWIDRHEVTVAAFRNGLAAGLSIPRAELDAPAVASAAHPACTFTTSVGSNELKAVTCLSWEAARAYCRFVKGDLPTDAQWEYAATVAGPPLARPSKSRYPWGNDTPQCSCDRVPPPCHAPVFGRAPSSSLGDGNESCSALFGGAGPLAVDFAEVENGDIAISNVVGLAGGVSEFTLDAFHLGDDPCWRAAPVADPGCLEEEPVVRGVRGGDFASRRTRTIGVLRRAVDPLDERDATHGFRCVYRSPPR